jgi:hypothetical protein
MNISSINGLAFKSIFIKKNLASQERDDIRNKTLELGVPENTYQIYGNPDGKDMHWNIRVNRFESENDKESTENKIAKALRILKISHKLVDDN